MFRKNKTRNRHVGSQNQNMDEDYKTIAMLLEIHKKNSDSVPMINNQHRRSSLQPDMLNIASSEGKTDNMDKNEKVDKKAIIGRKAVSVSATNQIIDTLTDHDVSSSLECSRADDGSETKQSDKYDTKRTGQTSTRRQSLATTSNLKNDKNVQHQSQVQCSRSSSVKEVAGHKVRPPLLRRHTEVGSESILLVDILFTRLLSANNFNQLYSVQADLCRQKKDLHIAKMRYCVVQSQVRSSHSLITPLYYVID